MLKNACRIKTADFYHIFSGVNPLIHCILSSLLEKYFFLMRVIGQSGVCLLPLFCSFVPIKRCLFKLTLIELFFLDLKKNEREIDHKVAPLASNPELSPKTVFATVNFFLAFQANLRSYLNSKI